MNEHVKAAETALKSGHKVTLSGFSTGSVGSSAGFGSVLGSPQRDGVVSARGEWVLEVFGPSGTLLHRCEVDAETARRLVMAGATEI